MSEQQNHLKNLVSQRNTLQQEIENLQRQTASKRELFLKVEGAIEYLTQVGVTLEEVESEETENTEEG